MLGWKCTQGGVHDKLLEFFPPGHSSAGLGREQKNSYLSGTNEAVQYKHSLGLVSTEG